MSITTHTSTIREYVKNHTKDDIAVFFEHQFVAKDSEIERLKKALDQAFTVLDGVVNPSCRLPADARLPELELAISEWRSRKEKQS